MLNQQGVSRLCYAGTVLRTKPDGLARTREPLQLGAELFGHAGIESDIEIQRLMIKALQLLGLQELHIDFSHVAIFESLVKAGNINADLEEALYAALQSKDKAAVAELAADLDASILQALVSLTDLNGGVAVLEKAENVLPKLPEIAQALANLSAVASKLSDLNVQVSFDLGELRGYHYHSGVVFAAYARGYTGPVALGGRYDEVGIAFGRARPATGFSLDLRGVVSALSPASLPKSILAPEGNDKNLLSKIETLRTDGLLVIQVLPNSEVNIAELNCDSALVLRNDEWHIETLK
jgi:ATP phosphoribosyltransferase regulatory subunit